MLGCVGRLQRRCAIDEHDADTISAMAAVCPTSGPRLAPVTHADRAVAELDDSANVLPTNPHQAERRRIIWDDRVHSHPADQGGCDSDVPSWTDPNDLHQAENRKVGGSMPSLPIAPPQLDVAGPRSALGPCRRGRARASAGPNGRQGFRGPAGRRASISAAGTM